MPKWKSVSTQIALPATGHTLVGYNISEIQGAGDPTIFFTGPQKLEILVPKSYLQIRLFLFVNNFFGITNLFFVTEPP